MTRLPKVLFVCHNHPDLHPGGTEIFSHALFRELRRAHGLDALYLACAGRVHRTRSPGTMLQAVGRAADEMLLWCGHFETFNLSQTDLHGVMIEFERLLAEVRPEVVHFHHVLLIGVEALQVVRRVLPKAAIVLTLHDYYAICANDGQMVTTGDRRLCRLASPDACARCFPDWGRDRFVMRELFVKQALTLVDRFVSPSAFLKQRYVDWGLPDDRIDIVRNGIAGPAPAPHRALPDGGRRNRFAFFGHLNPFKGAMVAIEAARRLAESYAGPFSLTLHGSAEFQSDEFKAAIAKALEGAAMVESRGRYGREEIPALMADTDWVIVPSIWWENAPLVIQEAFHHRRPVICSNIGGMAEAVLDGVDGLWFRAGDAAHLSERMEQGLDQALWTQLANNIAPPRSIAAAAADHLALFERVLAEPRRVEWPQPSEQAVRRRRRKTSTEPEQAGAAQ